MDQLYTKATPKNHMKKSRETFARFRAPTDVVYAMLCANEMSQVFFLSNTKISHRQKIQDRKKWMYLRQMFQQHLLLKGGGGILDFKQIQQ